MNTTELNHRLKQILQPSPSGVVGMADALLELCFRECIEIRATNFGITSRQANGTETNVIVNPWPRSSVFRAILARIIARCNDYSVDSVPIYGGDGIWARSMDEVSQLRISVSNTTSDSRIHILPEPNRVRQLDTQALANGTAVKDALSEKYIPALLKG